MNVKIGDLVESIRGELEDYASEVAGDVKEAVKEAAKAAVKEVKAKSPKDSGAYRKGWGQVKVSETAGSIVVVVRNKKRYYLTHLLENGHALKGGGRTRAYPHIKPAEELAERELEKKVKLRIGG